MTNCEKKNRFDLISPRLCGFYLCSLWIFGRSAGRTAAVVRMHAIVRSFVCSRFPLINPLNITKLSPIHPSSSLILPSKFQLNAMLNRLLTPRHCSFVRSRSNTARTHSLNKSRRHSLDRPRRPPPPSSQSSRPTAAAPFSTPRAASASAAASRARC